MGSFKSEPLPPPPPLPIGRVFREGVSVYCYECGSTMSKTGFLRLLGKRKCDHSECKTNSIKNGSTKR